MTSNTIDTSYTNCTMKSDTIGICNTCKNNEICINVGSFSNPKWYCEGFDCNGSSFMATREEDVDFLQSEYDSFTSNSPDNYNKDHTGLCINCEHCQTCKLATPESDVWHCEEYK